MLKNNRIQLIEYQKPHFDTYLIIGLCYLIAILSLYICSVNNTFNIAMAPNIFRHKIVYILYAGYINLVLFLITISLLYPLISSQKRILCAIAMIFFSFVISTGFLYNFFDIKLFTIEGSHFYDVYITSALSSGAFLREINLPKTTLYKIASLIVIVMSIPYLLFYVIEKCKMPQIHLYIRIVIYLLPIPFTIFFYHRWQLLEISRTLPDKCISRHLIKETEVFDEEYLKPNDKSYQHYKVYRNLIKPSILKKKNILIIQIESLRFDYDNDIYMPYLHGLESFSTIKSENSFSSANTTERSIFSLLYGINSAGFDRFQQDSLGSMAFDVLKKAGYKTYGYSASSLKNWLKAGFIFKNFDQYTEFLSPHPYNDDSVMIATLSHEYKNRNRQQSTMYWTFLVSSHHNYYYPPSFEKYKPVMDQSTDFYMESNALEQKKELVINRYKNSVRYDDYNVKKILKIFEKEIKDNNLIVLITGDHGEEFWDHGLIGHSANNLFNCRIHVPLVFHLPGIKPIKYNITSNTEMMPTILDYLGVKDSTLFSFFDYASLLKVKNEENRFIINTGCDFKNQNKACIITNTKKYWITVKDKNVLINKEFLLNDTLTVKSKKDFLLRKKLKQTIYLTYRYLR